MNESAAEFDGDWHRVHWFGLIELLTGAAVAIGVLAMTGLPNGIGAWAEEAFGALAGVRAIAAYFLRRYRVTPTVLTSRAGVLFRSEESMRRVDVQSVTTTVPPWYRPFDLVRLIVKDGSGNEIDIGPLKRSLAERFQRVMQPDRAETDTDKATSSSGLDTHHDLSQSVPGVVGAESLVTRRVDVPFWKLVAVTVGDFSVIVVLAALAAALYFGWWIAGMSVVVVWSVWNGVGVGNALRFRLTIASDEIRADTGLLAEVQERTRRDRIEFLRVDETLVGRLLGVERVSIGTGDDEMIIAPMQRRGEWRALAAEVFDIEERDEPPIDPISARSVPRFRLRGVVVAVLAGAGAVYWGWAVAVGVAVGVGLVAAGWYPRARLARFGVGGDDQMLSARTGFGPRRRWLFRVDQVDATVRSATVGQRRVNLATLEFSGRGPASSLTIPDLDHRVAIDWDRRVAARVAARMVADEVGPAGSLQAESSDAAASDDDDEPAASGAALGLGTGQPLPPAALSFNTFTSVSVVSILCVGWLGASVWALFTQPPDSMLRSPWLIGIGSTLLAVGSALVVWMTRRVVRSERWSVDDVFAERLVGVIVQTSTRIKFEHVAVARWAQGPLERRFGLGQVRLFTRGSSNPDLILAYLDEADARDIAELHRSRPGSVAPTSTQP